MESQVRMFQHGLDELLDLLPGRPTGRPRGSERFRGLRLESRRRLMRRLKCAMNDSAYPGHVEDSAWIALGVLLAIAVAACGGHTPAPRASTRREVYPPSACEAPRAAADADDLDRTMGRAMIASHIPSLSVAIRDHGHVRAIRSYGYANLETCTRVTVRSRFGIGSISKMFTALGVLVLVQRGTLRLDDPIVRYLPEGRGVWDAVTIRQLLTHTSGIPDYADDDNHYPSIELHRSTEPDTSALVKMIAAARLNFRPGSEWAYSNTGYLLASIVVERAARQPFQLFMHDAVFVPLGMTATRYASPTEVIPDLATPYHFDDDKVTHGPYISEQFSHWGDMGMLSTAGDLARWFDAVGSAPVISASLWAQMLSPVRLTGGEVFPYGFGVALYRIGDRTVIGHGGSFRPGYVAYWIGVPATGAGVAILSTGYVAGRPIPKLALALLGAIEPDVAPVARRPTVADPQPAITGALARRLHGERGAIRVRPAAVEGFLDSIADMVRASRTPVALRFAGCQELRGTPLGAMGAPVARQCGYQLTGGSDAQTGGADAFAFFVWLTPDNTVVGLDPW
jgi:CubicO group peptidase (beta-lactamase class C family)